METMRTLIERLEEAFKRVCPPGHKMVFGKCTKVDSRNWKPTRSEVQRETNKSSYKEKLNNRRRSDLIKRWTTEDQAFDEMDLTERAEILVKGDMQAVQKSLMDAVMDKIAMSGVYLVVEISHDGKRFKVSGTVRGVADFIARSKPPVEDAKIVEISTDRNWTRSKAEEV